MKKLMILAGLLSLFSIHSGAAPSSPTPKIMVLVLENTSFSTATKQAFISELRQMGGSLLLYSGVTHPSQGNYVAMMAGDLFGIRSDSAVNIDTTHLGDLIEGQNKTWKAYLEDYPGNCFTGNSGNYVRKHNPFISFANIQKNSSRCQQHLVPYTQLTSDYRAHQLPDFSLIVPNLKNDGHDTGATVADRWLRSQFESIVHTPQFLSEVLLVVTFDESENLFDHNRILTVLVGAGVQPGSSSNGNVNHYSLLQMIESKLGLPSLGRNDRTAVPIQDIWAPGFRP